jgi:signal transduction histidine kinase
VVARRPDRAIARQAALALHHNRLIDLNRREERRKGILEERNRLARDIHDNLAQGFAAILMQLQAVQRGTRGLPPAAAGSIDTAIDLARTHLTEARRSVGALRPTSAARKTSPRRSSAWWISVSAPPRCRSTCSSTSCRASATASNARSSRSRRRR